MTTRKFNKPLSEDLEQTFKQAHFSLEEYFAQVNVLAENLASGALGGAAGDTMKEVISIDLPKKIELLSDKMAELENDVRKAREQYIQAEMAAKRRFS